MKKKIIFTTMVMLGTSLSGGALSKDDPALYFCPKYYAIVSYLNGEVIKSYSGIYEDDDEIKPGANSISKIRNCSTKSVFCVAEDSVKDGVMSRDNYTLAVPRKVAAGDKYTINGIKFSTKGLASAGNKKIISIEAESLGDGDNKIRYKFIIEQGKGITDIFFEKTYATFPFSMSAPQIHYSDMTCRLMSEYGLFRGIVVNVQRKNGMRMY